jgi:dTDP-4-amino-4,6-dideoxy-D-galactose acyltransferase
MQKVDKLIWDSEFFGYNIGMIDINSSDFDPELNFNSQFDLIYLYSDKKQQSKYIPELIDVKVNYKKEITPINVMPQNIEEYNGKLIDNLIDLALLSGHHSRFKKDTYLSVHFERLYTEWIQKSISGALADKVLVYVANNDILGFVTLKKTIDDYVQIGLIAVHDKHWGKGIGSSLLDAISFVYPNNKIIVLTQEENKGATALYKKKGFQIDKKKYIYHLWK